MSIHRIRIQNCRCLEDIEIYFKNINLLIGENGTGKTTVLQALHYFYDNLTESRADDSWYDKKNPFKKSLSIAVEFDFTGILNVIVARRRGVEWEEDDEGASTGGYYRSIERLPGKDRHLRVEMRQDPVNGVRWNVDYKTRKLLKALFPLYVIDVKDNSSTDWELAWKIIGDITKSAGTDVSVKTGETGTERYLNASGEIKRRLAEAEISIEKWSVGERAVEIAKVDHGGEKFMYRGNDLDFSSNGTNMLNYLRAVVVLVAELADKKLKWPVVVMDEPELCLHHKFIDRLAAVILEHGEKIQFLLSTHSPRMTKDFLNDMGSNSMNGVRPVNIYDILLENGRVGCRRMKLFSENSLQERFRITDEHANAYFSRLAVFVEGASEIEIFSNRHLRRLYPQLDSADFFEACADDVNLRIMGPFYRNTGTKYLILADGDKILEYTRGKDPHPEAGHFRVNRRGASYNLLANWKVEEMERKQYGKVRRGTWNLRRRIQGMLDKSTFRYHPCWGYALDGWPDLLWRLVRSYFLNYNIYVIYGTVESLIVNPSNYAIYGAYLADRVTEEDLGAGIPPGKSIRLKNLEEILRFSGGNAQYEAQYKATMLRLLVKGKCESTAPFSEKLLATHSGRSGIDLKKLQTAFGRRPVSEKASGNFTRFFDSYFCALQREAEACGAGDADQYCRDRFEFDFWELSRIIALIGNYLYN